MKFGHYVFACTAEKPTVFPTNAKEQLMYKGGLATQWALGFTFFMAPSRFVVSVLNISVSGRFLTSRRHSNVSVSSRSRHHTSHLQPWLPPSLHLSSPPLFFSLLLSPPLPFPFPSIPLEASPLKYS